MRKKKTDIEKILTRPMSLSFIMILSFFDSRINTRITDKKYQNELFRDNSDIPSKPTFGLLSKFAKGNLGIPFDESNYQKIWGVLEKLELLLVHAVVRSSIRDDVAYDFDVRIPVGRPKYTFNLNFNNFGNLIINWLELNTKQKKFIINSEGFSEHLGKMFFEFLVQILENMIFIEDSEIEKDFLQQIVNNSINKNEFTVNNLLLGFFIKQLQNPRYFLDYSDLIDYSRLEGLDAVSYSMGEDKLLENHPFYQPSQIIFSHCYETLPVRLNPFVFAFFS